MVFSGAFRKLKNRVRHNYKVSDVMMWGCKECEKPTRHRITTPEGKLRCLTCNSVSLIKYR